MTDEERKARRKEINRQAGNTPLLPLPHLTHRPLTCPISKYLRSNACMTVCFCAARRAHQKKLDNLARLQNVRPNSNAIPTSRLRNAEAGPCA